MALCELDSFVLKFKNLWQAGRNANLTIKTIGGKVEANLSVELGDAPVLPIHFKYKKSSPSRQRRRDRRAAARSTANIVEGATESQSITEEVVGSDAEQIANHNLPNANEKENEEELMKLRDALSKRDIDVCRATSAYIEVLEKMDELQKENRLIKKENEALKLTNVEKVNFNGDEERDKILDAMKKNKFGKCEFVGKIKHIMRSKNM